MIRLAALAGLAGALPTAGQSPLYREATATSVVEHRQVRFDAGIRLDAARQTAWRLVGGVPVGRRLFVDVGTSYAVTALRSEDGIEVDLAGFTDTEVRAALTLGRDAAVVSLLVSVPTGEERVGTDVLPLLRSIAQNFLPFPVSRYGAGLGLTGGVAGGRQVGTWTVGGAASLRYMASYSPFTDLDAEYDPGLEARARLGVQRPLGRDTQISAAVTASTFGTDDLGGPQPFSYRSGNRYALEGALVRQLGRSTLRANGWWFSRAAGDSSGVEVVRAREEVLYGLVGATIPAGALAIDPSLDLRTWSTADGATGRMVSGSVGVRLGVTPRLVLAPVLRLESGRLEPGPGIEAGFSGLSFAFTGRWGR